MSNADLMTELKNLLEKSLIDNTCMTVAIRCPIPKLDLKIINSRQMIRYGIGLDRKHGFTLTITVEKNSKKGKVTREKLNENNFLAAFNTFEGKSSITYTKDYKQEIELLEKTIHNLLDKSDIGKSYQMSAIRTDGTFTIE